MRGAAKTTVSSSTCLLAFVPGTQGRLGGCTFDVACIAGQGFGLADPGDSQQFAWRGAGGEVITDEAGPAPAHRQAGGLRIGCQAAGEAIDEVLVATGGGNGAEHQPAPRTAGQFLRERAVTSGDRHGAG